MSRPSPSPQVPPAVPAVLEVPPLAHPYRLPPLERWPVLYHTAARVRVQKPDGTRVVRRPDQVIAMPDDAAWAALTAAYHAYQAALDDLAATLRALGSYAGRLAAAGPDAPNPLCPTVIEIADPAGYYAPSLVLASPVPALDRTPILRHTAKMWEAPGSYGLRAQKDLFVCPDDRAWAQVQAAHSAAQLAASAWQDAQARQGTYAAAAMAPVYPPARAGQIALPW